MSANADSKIYQVKLTGEGLDFDRQVDEPTALAIVQIVLSGATPATSTRPLGLPVSGSGKPIADGRTSLRGFIDQVGAKILAAKIVAIAAHRRDVEGKEEFSQEDIGGRFKGAGEPAPSNISRDFGTAVGYGWIAEDHRHPGLYFITKDGDAALATKFEGVRGSSGRKSKRRKKADEK